MYTFVEALGVTSKVALDGGDAETEGVWKTSAGLLVPYLEWNTKQQIPNPNGGQDENCIGFRRKNLMFDIPCSTVVTVICEKPSKNGKLLF